MKVLQLLMHENSGAGKASIRLHNGLLENTVDSLVMVSHKSSDLASVLMPNKLSKIYKQIQPVVIDKLTSRLKVSKNDTFSVNCTPSSLLKDIQDIAPDLINLHWIGWEFLKIEDFKRLGVPLIWTLHDMWAFTGGCHYSGECNLYTKSCGSCPQLTNSRERDLSRWVWHRKQKAWQDLNLTLVTPSKWLAECAKNSLLCQDLRIEVIPNGLDIKTYKPIDKKLARSILGLSIDAQIVLFGAVDATSSPRKGFKFLEPALQKIRQYQDLNNIELVIFGSSQPLNPPNLGFKVTYLGRLNDDISLSLVYAAADVFVAPSIEDNLPNTVLEALACGTPCVSFKIGGLSDAIEHEQNGYLAQPFDTDDLAHGIVWVLADRERHRKLGDRARAKVESEFTTALCAHRYQNLYENLLS
ncbi:glycosyltransferase family 4 protein [Chamaesiphon sp.]|uniref:glycosyltransferase family 4 protein n=1 Tax=Chamaesiphon sp. TaxID=2814140 RepID=UPI0035931CC4